MMRKPDRFRKSVLAATLVVAASTGTLPAVAQEPGDGVEELRRLNAAVARMAVLMERLVDERRTEVLQRQLAIGNERLAEVEARLEAGRAALEERRAVEASLMAELEQFAQPLDGTLFDAEMFRERRKAQQEQTEARLAEVRRVLVELDGRVRDLESRAFGLRERQDELNSRIEGRLGLVP